GGRRGDGAGGGGVRAGVAVFVVCESGVAGVLCAEGHAHAGAGGGVELRGQRGGEPGVDGAVVHGGPGVGGHAGGGRAGGVFATEADGSVPGAGFPAPGQGSGQGGRGERGHGRGGGGPVGVVDGFDGRGHDDLDRGVGVVHRIGRGGLRRGGLGVARRWARRIGGGVAARALSVGRKKTAAG